MCIFRPLGATCWEKQSHLHGQIDPLVAREYADTARRFIAGQKDNHGRRRFYAPKRDGIYINVETAKALDTLAIIIEKNNAGRGPL